MDKINSLNFKNGIIKSTALFTSVFPISLAATVFLGFDFFYCAVFSSYAALFAAKPKTNNIMPAYADFLILMFAINAFGASTASLAIFICGILSVIFSLLPVRIKLSSNPVTSGVMLACAMTVTVMLTTHYFGIGATGNNVTEMLGSYLSLGFHPNWRGVLYGTIVMVIMITFPRKFKSLNKIIKAPFIAIAVTLILNFFLNPSEMPTAINEAEEIFSSSSIGFFTFFSNFECNYLSAVLCGITLFVIHRFALSQNDTDKKKCLAASISDITASILGTPILPYGIEKNSVVFGSIAAVLSCLIVFGMKDSIGRMPVHSLAVVLIVGAWGNVKWREIKKVFTSPLSVLFFILPILACLSFGFVNGILISSVLYFIYSFIEKSKIGKVST